MRTYGRIQDPNNPDNLIWEEVDTTADGQNDLVYLTTLCQVLQLNLNESPFYATYGIPQVQTILQQVYPNYYVAYTQQQFAPYFASLLIALRSNSKPPTYNVLVTTHQGVKLNAMVAIPT